MSAAGRGICLVSVSQVLGVTHLEDELSESIWVLVIEQESVAGVGRPGLKEEQEELVPGRTALKKAEYQLQQPTQLQHTTTTKFRYFYILKVASFDRFRHFRSTKRQQTSLSCNSTELHLQPNLANSKCLKNGEVSKSDIKSIVSIYCCCKTKCLYCKECLTKDYVFIKYIFNIFALT